MANTRPDHTTHRVQFEKNKKKIYASQEVCGICGRPVDFNRKFPDPLSPTIDHIVPLSKGGHPFAIENMQLAHFCCNRQKSDRLVDKKAFASTKQTISNRVLPHSMDWRHFHDYIKSQTDADKAEQ